MKFIIFFLIGISHTVLAGEGPFFRYGLGINAPKQEGSLEIKYFSIGYQSPINEVFDWKVEGGVWADTSNRVGRKSNGFLSASVGIEPESTYFYMHTFFGVAAIAQTDSTLGSIPQFTEDIGVGFQDKKKRRMGFSYKHFSNAGIWTPNRGRDFITFIIQIRW